MAIMAAGAADATVYLLKDGNVVASYSDNEVDGITFEDPTQYDVVTENVLMHTSYYSDAMATTTTSTFPTNRSATREFCLSTHISSHLDFRLLNLPWDSLCLLRPVHTVSAQERWKTGP